MRTQEELQQIITSYRNGDFEGCFCGRSTTNDDLILSLLEELYTLRATQPRSQVQWFSGEMERVLKENDHKGGWDDIQALILLNQLKEETAELADAIENDISPEHIIKEAVDVANFAMMIADNMRKIQ